MEPLITLSLVPFTFAARFTGAVVDTCLDSWDDVQVALIELRSKRSKH